MNTTFFQWWGVVAATCTGAGLVLTALSKMFPSSTALASAANIVTAIGADVVKLFGGGK